MGPVLILQFMADDTPAYLGTCLQRAGVATDVRFAEAGGFPRHLGEYRALALLGGAMSVNDDLPYLRDAERLVTEAITGGVPVLGHCLGGQLMARALGAGVGASPAPEVGWHALHCIASPQCHAWFGPAATQRVFHWHYEAFDLPPHAVPLASSPQCKYQAFALGPHLAMQFHVEVDAAKIELWCGLHDAQYEQARKTAPTVHDPGRIRADTAELLDAQQRLADRIYGRWLSAAG
ncbi:MAG: type 1 glutamine amidotransferase [Ideonella sp.]|nr:type 1 glutamine amidotransferase [Ideonella sp.]MCC7457971.1 type 1 glutamine amidotransferase [Nitrospira sp.]